MRGESQGQDAPPPSSLNVEPRTLNLEEGTVQRWKFDVGCSTFEAAHMAQTAPSAIDDILNSITPPDLTLDIKPQIESIEDAELALHEIAWCNAVQAAIRAKLEETMAELNEIATREAAYDVGEERVPIGDRRKILEAELLRWGDEHRTEICQGKKKSAEFRNGKLKWRDAKDAVDYLEGESQKSAIEAVGNESGLLAKIEKLVDAIGWHGVFQAKLSVNKTNAVKARQKQQLTDEQLADIGLEFKAGEEYISVEPAEFVRSGQ
jgi:phage host-nuclease inhibitor protein Gam